MQFLSPAWTLADTEPVPAVVPGDRPAGRNFRIGFGCVLGLDYSAKLRSVGSRKLVSHDKEWHHGVITV